MPSEQLLDIITCLIFSAISYHSEYSFISLFIQSFLSHSSTQAHAIIHRWKRSPHNPLSTPTPSPSCIPQIQTGPMNESIFSFQHCLNFQLKMSRVSPDCSEGPSITGPPQASFLKHMCLPQFFVWYFILRHALKTQATEIHYIHWMDTQTGHKKISYCNKPSQTTILLRDSTFLKSSNLGSNDAIGMCLYI